MMKQAQKLQQEIEKTKQEINQKIFPGKYSAVETEVNGRKMLLKLKIDKTMEVKSAEDFELLEDMIIVAVNDALAKVDQETDEKMGKYGSGLSGLL